MIQSTFLMMTYWTILEITIILEFPLIFGPGYDYKLFIFKQVLFTYDLFEEEKIDNDDYCVVEISKAEISYIYFLFLDGLFKLLDTIFQPLDGMDENIYTNIWLDYGKIEGTP